MTATVVLFPALWSDLRYIHIKRVQVLLHSCGDHCHNQVTCQPTLTTPALPLTCHHQSWAYLKTLYLKKGCTETSHVVLYTWLCPLIPSPPGRWSPTHVQSRIKGDCFWESFPTGWSSCPNVHSRPHTCRLPSAPCSSTPTLSNDIYWVAWTHMSPTVPRAGPTRQNKTDEVSSLLSYNPTPDFPITTQIMFNYNCAKCNKGLRVRLTCISGRSLA